ncbi:hypothetical protein PG994_006666 [Apiospora phragmitis]|uniref:Uncharacterized protein n=1 Tax=Apiospora phragmitis TaxID=2905665 RepID=A0ABR1VFR2_9PEZI
MGRMADPTSIANQELRKIWFAMKYLFDAGLYLPKLSMVAIYYHIPLHFQWLRRALYFIGFFVGSSFFITFFSDTFWCGPHPSVQCRTSLSGREKAGLIGIFTLGAVTIGVSSGRRLGHDGILRLHHDRRGHGAAAADPESVGGHDLHVQALGLGLGRHRTPKFFKGGSGGTGDSVRELKPGQSISTTDRPPQLQQQPPLPSSWFDQILSMPDEGNSSGGGGGDIPLSPMTPVGQNANAIIKTERFSISSGHQPASPVTMIDLESGGGIWDGRSRLLV